MKLIDLYVFVKWSKLSGGSDATAKQELLDQVRLMKTSGIQQYCLPQLPDDD